MIFANVEDLLIVNTVSTGFDHAFHLDIDVPAGVLK